MDRVSESESSIGIFGGSFDPIHNGHLYLAEQALRTLDLDRILFLPALNPPHKSTCRLTEQAHRIEMIRCALSGYDRMEIDETEIRRGGISYTIDTVKALTESLHGARLHFIIGSDSLRELHTWKSIREIAKRVTFVVLSRMQGEEPLPHPELERQLKGMALKSVILPVPPLPVSSTEIRNSIRKGNPPHDLVPQKVMEYIEKHDLYR